MHILMRSEVFPPHVGGIESHVYYLCRQLVRCGHSCTVITAQTENTASKSEVMDGITVYRTKYFGTSLFGWFMTAIAGILTYCRVAKDADLLHTHTIFSAMPGLISAYLFKKPHLLTLHHSRFIENAKKPIWRILFRFVLKRVNFVFAPSDELEMICRNLCQQVVTHKITNAVDTEIFRPCQPAIKREREAYLLICPRRLVRKNGVEYLIRAMPLLQEKVDVELHILGDGPLRRELGELTKALSMATKVHFWGAIDNTKMSMYLSSADVVVIPSLLEATSIAALEAMACERVVVASDVGGLPEIIDNEVGRLFEVGNVADLADQILSLLHNTDRAQMGQAARRRVQQQWSVAHLAQIHEGIYQKFIERGDIDFGDSATDEQNRR